MISLIDKGYLMLATGTHLADLILIILCIIIQASRGDKQVGRESTSDEAS